MICSATGLSDGSLLLKSPNLPPPSSRPDKLWFLPTLAPLTTEAGRKHHPLTSSSIIRDGQEPLWVLSNSIQEFSQPVQSSLDKLTPRPPTHNSSRLDTASLLCLTPRSPKALVQPPIPASTQAHTKSRRRKEKWLKAR
ncbi:unnamed protein product [Pleuronectes platessa]|uniref:Uncharacterized protein n=1 Tax=Pleuronectes platessa TaxID=8262 RepID=A0A9N7UUL6_PLEPL|nr:unnamed protein product [Pleuronectes platessa]